MIPLEKISALAQIRNQSFAILSERRRNENPMLTIRRNGNYFDWELSGLRVGEIQIIDENNPRANHIAIYIGMDDLSHYVNSFADVNVPPIGLVDGLRIPAGTERPGGTQIRWRGPVTRVNISDFDIVVPPLRLLRNDNDNPTINVDRETSPYPIDNGLGRRTTRELHFGIDHQFVLREDHRVNIGRIRFSLGEGEYATVLEAIHNSIDFHNEH